MKSSILQFASRRNPIRIELSFMFVFVLHRSLLTMRGVFLESPCFFRNGCCSLLFVSRTCAFPWNKPKFQYIHWNNIYSIRENCSNETDCSIGKQCVSNSWFDGFTDELSRELHSIESLISTNGEEEYC